MQEVTVEAPSLWTQLVSGHRTQWVQADTMEAWLSTQQGDAVLLFAGDPIRFPEALDVAVVLPELRAVSAR